MQEDRSKEKGELEDQPDPMAKRRQPVSSRFSGEDLTHWAWTEPSGWKLTMLATLEYDQVRGGKKWHSLIDKVYCPENLESAYREVAANQGAPGVDNITIEDFTANKRVNIPKPGTNKTRPLTSSSNAKHARKPNRPWQWYRNGLLLVA